MLKAMHSSKFFSMVILGGVIFIITISFLFWGIGPKSNDQSGVLAKIEGERIMIDEYWNKYNEAYRRMKEVYKTEEELKALDLKESVLSSMIDRNVLLVAAKRAGIDVSDEELRNEIINTSYFQKNGSFDPALYERILSQNRMSPQSFEAEYRNDIIVNKMNRLIEETAELTSDEMNMLNSVKEGKDQLIEAFLSQKKNQAMRVYIDGMKQMVDITVNRDLIM
ncbi:MAG: SurA N-terminal domain-containing protein [Thermodesulfovibrionia bacterium]|nr:SurA N-terminal domain-containing protein [Thermodesulfovibrionia bacterium]